MNLFERMIFSEAPEDEPIDTGPPDLPEESPPEVGGEPGDIPPELPVDNETGDDPGMPELETDGEGGESEGRGEATLEVSEKISVAMNYRLYQRFLTLSNTVANQLSTIKAAGDMIHSASPTAMAVVEPLSKLGENIRLYLINNFLDNNYSKNLLFYNKCLNLVNLLNEILGQELKRGKPEPR